MRSHVSTDSPRIGLERTLEPAASTRAGGARSGVLLLLALALGALTMIALVIRPAGAPVAPAPAQASDRGGAAARLGDLPPATGERVEAQPAPTVERGDDSEPPAARPRPADRAAWTEREFLSELEGLAQADPEGFAVHVDNVLSDAAGPDCEKVAALRALYHARGEAAAELFVRAVATLPDVSSARGLSVPRTALRRLGDRAAREPAARTILDQIAWDGAGRVGSELRALALCALIAAAPPAELAQIRQRVARERDESVFARAGAALVARDNVGDAASGPTADQE